MGNKFSINEINKFYFAAEKRPLSLRLYGLLGEN